MSWQKIVKVEDTLPDRLYFVAMEFGPHGGFFQYWSRYLSGKETWSVKPGIAIRHWGGPLLISAFKKNPTFNLVAIEVPANADKRWKARGRRYKFKS